MAARHEDNRGELGRIERRGVFVTDLQESEDIASVDFTRNGFQRIEVVVERHAGTGTWQQVAARARGLDYSVTHETVEGRDRLVLELGTGGEDEEEGS